MGYDEQNDPFYDPPEAQLIGKAFVVLDSLHYFLNMSFSAMTLITLSIRSLRIPIKEVLEIT